MGTVPNPRLWAAGEIPTAAHFNADIKDAQNFFKTPPTGIVRNTTNVPDVVTNTWTVLTWNTDVIDTDAIHDTGSNTSRLVAKTAGYYYVFARIRWEWHIDNDGMRGIWIKKNANGSVANGTTVANDFRHSNNWSSTPNNRHGCGCTGFTGLLAVNDYLECFVWHDQDNLIGSDNSEIWHSDTTTQVRFGMYWVSD